jgi:hypothetical protein
MPSWLVATTVHDITTRFIDNMSPLPLVSAYPMQAPPRLGAQRIHNIRYVCALHLLLTTRLPARRILQLVAGERSPLRRMSPRTRSILCARDLPLRNASGAFKTSLENARPWIFPSSNRILVRIEKMRRDIEVVYFAEWPVWSEFRYRERLCTPVTVMSSVVR